jgi:hypothetical protein
LMIDPNSALAWTRLGSAYVEVAAIGVLEER